MASTSEVFLTSIRAPRSTLSREAIPEDPELPEYNRQSTYINSSITGSEEDEERHNGHADEALLEEEEEEEEDDGNEREATPIQSESLKNWLDGLEVDSEEYDTDLEDDFPPGRKPSVHRCHS